LEFLSEIPKPDSHLRIASGYGCATLLWKLKNEPEELSLYSCAGTIQDFLVSMLCDLESPVMSIQNAASWGYFNTQEKTWNLDILKTVDFPIHLLPKMFVDYPKRKTKSICHIQISKLILLLF